MLQKLSYNLAQALMAILQRPMRSFLTSLGIIFGVGAVIAMMAIGQGAKQEVLEQMKILGSNNLIIEPILTQSEEELSDELGAENEKQRYSPGLTLADAQSIKDIVPGIEGVSVEILLETAFIRDGRKRSGKVVGVTDRFFEHASFGLERGQMFTAAHYEDASPVCIVGSDVKAKFFPQEDPLGKRIKVGKNWLTIIGIANRRSFSKSSLLDLGIRDYNMDIYTPVKTVLLRYKNRSRVSPYDIQMAARSNFFNNLDEEESTASKEPTNYHQIDRMVVTVKDGNDMYRIAEVIRRMLTRRHNNVVDTEVKIPEELLAQKEETTEMFNFVLIAIAAISLLVGGIGIMNIMLASVMERIKEIGVRLSLGATKKDIITQFLSESVALSLAGGIIGILVGVGLSYGIKNLFGVLTIVTVLPIAISFFVSVMVGIVFGIFPAMKAAKQDPVISLRHE